MRKELCFRVEHKDHKAGVYNSSCRAPGTQSSFEDPRHPSPMEDQSIRPFWINLMQTDYADKYYFGFSSMDQLRRWIFSEEYMNHLKHKHMVIGIYQTDDYHIGDTQMVFRKERAIRIGAADII